MLLDKRSYELAFEALSFFQPSKQEEAAAAGAYEKLSAVGVEKQERTSNPDLVLRTLAVDEVAVEMLESERDVILAAIDKPSWPTFALAKKARAVERLRNAEARPAA